MLEPSAGDPIRHRTLVSQSGVRSRSEGRSLTLARASRGVSDRVLVRAPGRPMVNDLAVQGGKILIAGTTLRLKKFTLNDFVLTRLLPDGSLDHSFGKAGSGRVDFGLAEAGEALAIQRDGKLVLGGVLGKYSTSFGVARLLPGD